MKECREAVRLGQKLLEDSKLSRSEHIAAKLASAQEVVATVVGILKQVTEDFRAKFGSVGTEKLPKAIRLKALEDVVQGTDTERDQRDQRAVPAVLKGVVLLL